MEAQLNAGVVTAALSLASLGDNFGINPPKCHVSMKQQLVGIGFVHVVDLFIEFYMFLILSLGRCVLLLCFWSP